MYVWMDECIHVECRALLSPVFQKSPIFYQKSRVFHQEQTWILIRKLTERAQQHQLGLKLRALCSVKTASYFIKRALYSVKRALYSIKTALYLWTYVLYVLSKQPHILSKEPYISESTCSMLCQNSLIFYQKKSALYSIKREPFSTQNNPEFRLGSWWKEPSDANLDSTCAFFLLSTDPYILINSIVLHQKSPIFYQMSPIFYEKSPVFC